MKEDRSFGIIPLRLDTLEVRVLLVKHVNGGHWGFPKGHAQEGESPRAVAEREMAEETGLVPLRYLDVEPLVEEYRFQRDGHTVHKIVLFFPAVVSGEVSGQPEEISALRWLSLEDAHDLITFPEGKDLITRLIQIFS